MAIFFGRPQQWNDTCVANCNPGVELPGRRIIMARRSDPDGASAALTSSFVAQNPWLREKPGLQAVFAAALALRGDEAIAEAVARVPDSIGHVELSRAAGHGPRTVPLLISDGREPVPTAESVRLALEEPTAPGAWPLTVRISAFVGATRGEPEKPLTGLFPLPATDTALLRGRVATHAAALRARIRSAPPAVALR